MNKKIKLTGQLKRYMQWPAYLTILLILMNIVIYGFSLKAGMVMTCFVILYFLIATLLKVISQRNIQMDLVTFAASYGQIQKELLRDFTIPYALTDEDGKLLWMNRAFMELTGKSKNYHKSITSIFLSITKDAFPNEETTVTEHDISFDEKDYTIQIQRINENKDEPNVLVAEEGGEVCLMAVYLFDITQINAYIKENQEQRLVAGLIYIDNYEEALESVEEVRRSLLVALIERKINKYISSLGGIVKRMEKDKYFVVIQEKNLPVLKENKFDLLNDVKTVNIGNDMAVTVSMSFGYSAKSYAENYEYARIAMELALARGGDQVVIKENDQILYFGGKSQQMEKNTRVKARVKAHALREFIEGKDKVVVMGHKLTDVDSFGASVGIYRAAKTLNKRAYIVINEVSTSVRPMLEEFKDNPNYEEDMFLNSAQAIEMVDRNTVLVVVDVNKPSYTECPELLIQTPTVVVLDHHRQGSEVISGAVLSYVEPYASSACEMVAEILQYFEEGIKIKNLEADCMYSGMMIDTDNFMTKTGVRTFEAAAFLRRSGADVTRVRKLFRTDFASYKARAEVVRHAEIYKGFAFSVCPSEGLDSPTIVGAQAANELLDIVGVRASFVLTDYKGQTYISARSIDDVNVQLIMEKMGGGGHMNIAGAQLECGIDEAKRQIMDTLDGMMEGGEI